MPGMNGTGPYGNGPFGRGLGPCGARLGGYGMGRGMRSFGSGIWGSGPFQMSPENEKEFLQQRKRWLEMNIAEIENRLQDFESKKEE